jgi:hypothetical protein
MDGAAGSDAEEHGEKDKERHPAGFHGPASEGWASLAGKRDGRKQFFFEKKNQKTFPGWHVPPAGALAPNGKSFLLLFFKKEALPFPTPRE